MPIMIDFKHNKVKIPTVIAGVLILLYIVNRLVRGTDDWVYSPASSIIMNNYVVWAGIVLLLAYFGTCIYLIAKGTPDERGINRRKRLGIALVLYPFVFSGLMILAAFLFQLETAAIIVSSAGIIALIYGVYYSIRHRVKIALISIFILVVLLAAAMLVPLFMKGLYGTITIRSSSVGGALLMESAGSASDTIGFSVGGAKDINNFRENIRNGYLPVPTDITYEGLYYDYFFDTGEAKPCDKLFCPSYSYAISKDPLSKEDEYYLQVGLNSGIKEADFQRKKLNLVIVLDISGSMSSRFNKYYYDQFGNRKPFQEEPDEYEGMTKMEIATQSVAALLGHLEPDDSFGMVLFDDHAYLGKRISRVGDTDMEAIKSHILEIGPRGGTYFEAGYKDGSGLFEEYINADPAEYENRIIFITDAMPNIGMTGEEGLLGMTRANADNKVYTTFIGVGVDFNTELIEYITKIRGANYYSVHSGSEFKARMDDEFEYMVTPLVFNLLLKVESVGYEIEKVYGSPEANEATGEIMKVNTLFPSKRQGGETKGGIVILKLKKTGASNSLVLKSSYEDREGKVGGDEVSITLPDREADWFDNTGIRKGILLARYVNLMKNWVNDERAGMTESRPAVPVMNYETGIIVPPDDMEIALGRWERQSVPLHVSDEYVRMVSDFKIYFEKEAEALGDPTLALEDAVLGKVMFWDQ
ncbi:MAG: hypothetical protein QS98_C0005G0037 [archaeon GW2011_AR3]|nr:MAG: hypothetical protein QS98_C0005G0037 [archaeon GW2011_AR3]